MAEDSTPPSMYYVIFHQPGPKWQPGVDFREQPGVMEHVKYMGQLFGQDKLKQGGPLE